MMLFMKGIDILKYKYSACPDFDIIYDEVSTGNRYEDVDFLVEMIICLK